MNALATLLAACATGALAAAVLAQGNPPMSLWPAFQEIRAALLWGADAIRGGDTLDGGGEGGA